MKKTKKERKRHRKGKKGKGFFWKIKQKRWKNRMYVQREKTQENKYRANILR